MRAVHHDTDRWDTKPPKDYMAVGKNRKILQAEGSETARQALENGDTLTLKHYIGDPAQEADLAGIKAVTRLQEIVAGPAPVIVLLGEMGDGKTDFSGLLGQLRERWVDGNLLVGSNIRTLERTNRWVRDDGSVEDGWIPNYPLLEEWVSQDNDPVENPQQPKLFIGDEFSTNASGAGEDGHKVRKLMGPLVFKIRKYGGALIYIGHDESSIHPMLWRVGTIIKKTSQNPRSSPIASRTAVWSTWIRARSRGSRRPTGASTHEGRGRLELVRTWRRRERRGDRRERRETSRCLDDGNLPSARNVIACNRRIRAVQSRYRLKLVGRHRQRRRKGGMGFHG